MRQTSSLRVLQAHRLGWRGHRHQHRQQERRRQPAVHERRHAARVEPEAAAGVRGGDRPQRAEQGRLRRHRAARLHARRAGEHRLVRRDEGPLHALRPQAREEARRRVGLPEPDRAPADANDDRRPPAGAVHPGAGGGGRDQRRDRPGRHRDGPARGPSGNFDTCLSGLGGRARPRRATSTSSFATSGTRNYSGYSNPRLDLILANGAARRRAQGAVDALPRGAADHPRRPADHRPLQPDQRSQPSARTSPACSWTADRRCCRSRTRSSSSDHALRRRPQRGRRRRRFPSARRARAPSRPRRRPRRLPAARCTSASATRRGLAWSALIAALRSSTARSMSVSASACSPRCAARRARATCGVT